MSEQSVSILLDDLARAGALSRFQANWLAENWEALSSDWASHPYLQSVPEHTRLYIDRLRQKNQTKKGT